MVLNYNIVEIEKPDELCSATFVVDNFQDHFYIHILF